MMLYFLPLDCMMRNACFIVWPAKGTRYSVLFHSSFFQCGVVQCFASLLAALRCMT